MATDTLPLSLSIRISIKKEWPGRVQGVQPYPPTKPVDVANITLHDDFIKTNHFLFSWQEIWPHKVERLIDRPEGIRREMPGLDAVLELFA